MARRHRSLIVALAFAALVAIAPGPVQAADSTPVAAASKQVGQGAHQIAQGEALGGTGELAKGVGSGTRDFFVDLLGG